MTATHSNSLLALLLLASTASGQPRPPATPIQSYYRTPALTDTDIVFAAEGDLWRVPIAGGSAVRLTTHPGNEASPVVSPDGSMLAFTAQYEGPGEVYTMPVSGGLPTRRTWFGGRSTPVVFGPTPAQGEPPLIVSTRRFSTLPNLQLVSIALGGNTVTRLPLEQAADAAFDDAGNLYFTRLEFQGSHTRRYVGGTVEQLWKFPAAGVAGTDPAAEAEGLTTDYDGTSASPMFLGGRVYFRSDRSTATTPTTPSITNIWSMSLDGRDLRQHTFHDDFEVRSPRGRDAASGGRIVYQHGADIRLLDLATGNDSPVAITLTTDLDQTREKWITKPFEYVTSAHLSPDGERVAITARGQVFVAPRKYGRLVDVTRASTARARDARFMPDGKSLLTLSDQSGEVELWTTPVDGMGEASQLTVDGDVLRWEAAPAPGGKHIAHHDKNQRLWIFDTAARMSRKIDENSIDSFGDLRWSPDSRWLAYAAYANNLHVQIKLYDTESGTITPLTTDRTNSYAPAWSPDGKFLYFLSDRHLQSVVSSPWGQDQPEPFFDRKTRVYALALRPGERSPFAEPDELMPKDEKKEEKPEKPADATEKANPSTPGMDSGRTDTRPTPPPTPTTGDQPAEKPDKPKGDDKPKPVEITLDGLSDRVYPTPIPAGNYGSLTVNAKALFMLSSPASSDPKPSLIAYAIDEAAMKKREWKPETLASDLKSFELSGDGKSLLIQTDKSLHIIDAAPSKPDDLGKSAVDLSDWKFSLRPRDEWRQMYNEAWRLHRDYFYDRAMHGVDWPAVKARYAPLVDRVASRADLSDVLAQMIGELSALHHFVVGGDSRSGPDQIQIASLGGLLTRDPGAGGWRIDTIWSTDPDEPDRYSPLATPGLDFKMGDIITRINGVETQGSADLSELLRDRAGEQVLIHYRRPNVDAADAEPRRAIVKPISLGSETEMRWDHWRLERRRMVESLGNGEIGYVHLKAMGGDDIADFTRQYYPVFNRKGLIIDARHNGGGNIDSWVLSRLMRKAWFFWQGRIGEPTWNMQYAFRGHMVLLCDQHTGSDGEALSEGFRRLGLGKVIGMRTWGGEIWLSFSNYLVDKGIASAAEIGVYGPEGTWLIEGRGVDPDMVVDNLPHATFRGEDAQLKAAIEELQKQIRERPVEIPPAPKRPDKSWKPR
ncbi:MAG: PD40 domain-containing protein [Phycisphaerales bacterium]|nr:PD40 domain-containing protein [Phycisphaerales bacterium]